MTGRLGHIAGNKRLGHVPSNGIRTSFSAYGFAGVNFWLKADSGLPSYASNASCAQWLDQISQQVCFGANTPTLSINLPEYNNYNAVNYATAGMFSVLRRNTNVAPSTVPIGTLVCIANYDTLLTHNYIAVFADNLALGGIVIGGSTAGGCGYWNGTTLFGSAVNTTAPKIIIASSNFVIVNGAVVSTTYNGLNTRSLFSIGGARATTPRLQGKVAEIINFENTMTIESALALASVLYNKYLII
jgi:hypothetical protein